MCGVCVQWVQFAVCAQPVGLCAAVELLGHEERLGDDEDVGPHRLRLITLKRRLRLRLLQWRKQQSGSVAGSAPVTVALLL